MEVNERRSKSDGTGRFAFETNLVGLVSACLAEIGQGACALTDYVIAEIVFFKYFEMHFLAHVFHFVSDSLFPNWFLASIVFSGCLVDLHAANGEFKEGVHLAERLGIAGQGRGVNRDVKRADDILAVLL